MGGRSGSSGIGGSAGGSKFVKEINGTGKIDLSDNPLKYGPKDYTVNKRNRDAVDKFEQTHFKDKVEHGVLIDKDGNIVEQNSGGKGEVTLKKSSYGKATTMSHNHPSDTGMLGGSFSEADIKPFVEVRGLKTMRATAKEGTYSISKREGFDGKGFQRYNNTQRNKYRRQMNDRLSSLQSQYERKEISYAKYLTERNKTKNKYLVNMHNSYIDGQSKYGYSYTLERR